MLGLYSEFVSLHILHVACKLNLLKLCLESYFIGLDESPPQTPLPGFRRYYNCH